MCRIGYPAFRIRMVSIIPEYRSCLQHNSLSNSYKLDPDLIEFDNFNTNKTNHKTVYFNLSDSWIIPVSWAKIILGCTAKKKFFLSEGYSQSTESTNIECKMNSCIPVAFCIHLAWHIVQRMADRHLKSSLGDPVISWTVIREWLLASWCLSPKKTHNQH